MKWSLCFLVAWRMVCDMVAWATSQPLWEAAFAVNGLSHFCKWSQPLSETIDRSYIISLPFACVSEWMRGFSGSLMVFCEHPKKPQRTPKEILSMSGWRWSGPGSGWEWSAHDHEYVTGIICYLVAKVLNSGLQQHCALLAVRTTNKSNRKWSFFIP